MLIIDPERGAIPNYIWVAVQENMVKSLKVVSKDQGSINEDYAFVVQKNKMLPSTEDFEKNNYFVNSLIASAIPDNKSTNFDENQDVIFHFDLYVRGENEDDGVNPLVPADDAAVQRLQYLAAMVQATITNLKNFYQGLSSGQIAPGRVSVVFNPVDDPEDSSTPYAPARVIFPCKFPYRAVDLNGLPALEAVRIAFQNWIVP